jgi:hypothetical protein
MEEFLTLVFWWTVSYLVFRYMVFPILDARRASREQELHKLMTRVDEITHRVEVVTENGITYWWDSDDGEFLAQGRDHAELIDHLKSRFPAHLFFVTANGQNCIIHHGSDWRPQPYDIIDKRLNIQV